MLRDRGTIKWQGMFLPEHVKLLREHYKGMDNKEKPVLDEQQIELMEETIAEGMEFNQELIFVCFKHNDFHTIVGKVHYIDPYKHELRIIDNIEKLHIVKIDALINVCPK
jgi:YolD-like protein